VYPIHELGYEKFHGQKGIAETMLVFGNILSARNMNADASGCRFCVAYRA